MTLYQHLTILTGLAVIAAALWGIRDLLRAILNELKNRR